jgi:glycosyltransferase involved in cell wall biosynthesis
MLKIINFISGKDFGGPKQSFLLYSKVLKELNYDITAIIRKKAKLSLELSMQNIAFEEIDYLRTTLPFFKELAIKKIKAKFDPFKADIILVHKQIDIELVKEALPTTKVIGVIHGFNAKNIEKADALIAVSNKIKEFLKKSDYKKPIYVIPNMIENFTPIKFKEFSNPVVIGSMGVFRRKKGFHILIEALAILKQKQLPFYAIIAGRGQRVWYYRYLQKKYNLEKKLEFKKWIPTHQKEEFLDNLDIYVLPSRTESFGMVVAEAMGRAKVVVATKCGGPEEIIDDKINGFLVENQNPKALANQLEEIIKKKSHTQLQKAAYTKAMQEYDIKSVKKKLDNTIKELFNG